MRNHRLVQDSGRSKLGIFAGAAFLFICCAVGPLLIGAACVLSVGIAGELAVVALVAIVAFALWSIRVSRHCC